MSQCHFIDEKNECTICFFWRKLKKLLYGETVVLTIIDKFDARLKLANRRGYSLANSRPSLIVRKVCTNYKRLVRLRKCIHLGLLNVTRA